MSKLDFIRGFFSWGYSEQKVEYSEEIEKELDKLSQEEE